MKITTASCGWHRPASYKYSIAYPVDDPSLDTIEAHRMMQRLLADKINSYAPIDELRLLLVSGAQADGVVTQGLTPLHYACHRDYLGAAKLLLVRGAKVNAVDEVGYSPLHLCAEKGNYRLLKLLLEYMAKVCYVDPKDSKKDFPLRDSVDEPLRMAIRRGHFECARLLLENGADANAKYFDGPEITHISPLDTHFLRLLLSYGADPNVHGRDGLTPIMRACRHREKGIKAIRIFLDNGADINALASAKKDLRTALHYAVLSGSIPLITFLLENGAHLNTPSGYDKPSALDLAILKDDVLLVDFLLTHKADPNSIHGCFGSSLHIACCGGSERSKQYEIVEMLLRHGADPNIVCVSCDVEGSEPSSSAIKSPLVEFLRYSSENVDKVPDMDLFCLLLSYGGVIYLRQAQIDPRGQLRNLLLLMERGKTECKGGDASYTISQLMLSLAGHSSTDTDAMEKMASSTSVSAETSQKLFAYMKNPRSLRQLCRISIRSAMAKTSRLGRFTPAGVDELPLPCKIKLYLLGGIV
uniref:SOCS box domain-containing protein n=1 Tax=Ditylenchus dipsaci TaxID=166011 RepID=A0A915E4V2_9BILA